MLPPGLHADSACTQGPTWPLPVQVLDNGLSQLHVPYSYGFSIILLTCLVKLATFPLTKQQARPCLLGACVMHCLGGGGGSLHNSHSPAGACVRGVCVAIERSPMACS